VIGRGFHLVTIWGIPIRVHSSWLLIAALLTWAMTVYFGQEFPYLGSPARLSLGLSAAMLLFGSVLAHELSHAVLALRNRVGIRGITLFVFGGAAEMVDEPETAGAELAIAAAGPAMSLFLAVVFFGFYWGTLGALPLPLVDLASRISEMNLLLVAFNLVPGFPLDGGRVLRAMLWGVWGNLSAATRVAAAVGSFFGGFVIVMGLMWIWSGNLIGGIWFLLIGFFLRNAAGSSYQQLLIRRALQGVLASDLMNRDVAVVSPHTSLVEAVDGVILPKGVSELPVVDEGRLVGMLQLSKIREREASTWPFVTASDVMTLDALAEAIAPGEEALKVLAILGSDDRMVPVVEDGHLLGVVTRRDVLRRLQLMMEVRR
jgi:Zn-dependent protease/predicted transcriptional regulator